MPKKFDWFSIEQDQFGDWEVFGHGVYPQSSVLAGQPSRWCVATFDTLEKAQEAYPDAEVPEYSTRIPAGWLPMSDTPPDWFDPMDAGERW